MKKYALVFPGQGAQEVGMGAKLHESFSSARDVFEEIDDSLDFALSRLIFEGPEEELRLTAHAQPAILAVSIAALRALQNEVLGRDFQMPEISAGHSLGEYTALVAADSLPLRDGALLVHLRGKWMQEAVPEGRGSMYALIGIEANEINEICALAAPNAECQVANYNSPGQIVISGEVSYVEKAVELAKQKGAKKAIKLNVSAPFHSRLMRPVADKLSSQFEKCKWSDPKFPIMSNAWAKPVSKVDDIRKMLFEQTYSPVLWQDSVLEMSKSGIENYIELGPGNVLSGLIKRCQKGLGCISAGTPESLESAAEFFSAKEDC
ncbi:MAG: ACP S-malonyltransferase [Synergistaceae bacterium]|nr:ACP S-malonyltransferase [Synergistaceae bacterium]